MELLKLQHEDDEITKSALKQREDSDGENDDENTGVEPAEDGNEEDDGNLGVEPPLRRSMRDRKEKEIFDSSSYLQTNTEEKKVDI